MKSFFLPLVLLILFSPFCFSQNHRNAVIDADATNETKALYKNLDKLARKHILFGHQHATEYGHGWSGEPDRSDTKSVTGSHPAVVGVDFGGLSGRADSVIQKNKNHLRKTIADTYDRGGITTAAWHFTNPVYRGGFYWNDTLSKLTVKLIIPGGEYHELYKKILRTIADLAKSIRGKDHRLVPVIFRPYHEFDGDWFWWGKSHCTVAEFTSLWRFTVSYLRDSLQVHNFIYAFSPDCKFTTEEEYLERYPGDEWVDMVGMDNYADFGRNGIYNLEAGYKKLKIVSDYAKKAGKLAAFTETGLESIPNADWWTEILLKTIQRSDLNLCYVLVWRNDTRSATHFYAPFPGQVSENNFRSFYNDPYTLFENDLKNIYKK